MDCLSTRLEPQQLSSPPPRREQLGCSKRHQHLRKQSQFDLFLNGFSGILRGIGILLTFIAASKLPSYLFAPTQYIQIAIGALIGYLYFGNIPTLNNYIGNIIIVGAGIYIIYREFKLSKMIVSQSIRPTILAIKKD